MVHSTPPCYLLFFTQVVAYLSAANLIISGTLVARVIMLY